MDLCSRTGRSTEGVVSWLITGGTARVPATGLSTSGMAHFYRWRKTDLAVRQTDVGYVPTSRRTEPPMR